MSSRKRRSRTKPTEDKRPRLLDDRIKNEIKYLSSFLSLNLAETDDVRKFQILQDEEKSYIQSKLNSDTDSLEQLRSEELSYLKKKILSFYDTGLHSKINAKAKDDLRAWREQEANMKRDNEQALDESINASEPSVLYKIEKARLVETAQRLAEQNKARNKASGKTAMEDGFEEQSWEPLALEMAYELGEILQKDTAAQLWKQAEQNIEANRGTNQNTNLYLEIINLNAGMVALADSDSDSSKEVLAEVDSDSSEEVVRPTRKRRSRSKQAEKRKRSRGAPSPPPETALIERFDLDALRLNASKTVGVIDLFCGCGGFSAGASLGGMHIIAGFDNNDKKLKVYNKAFGEDKGIKYTIKDAKNLMEKVETYVRRSQLKKVHVHASPVCVKMSQANRRAGRQKQCEGPNISLQTWNTTIDFLKMCADKEWFFSYSIEDAPGVRGKKEYMEPLGELGQRLKEKYPSKSQHNQIVEASEFGLASSRKRFYSVWCKDEDIKLHPFYSATNSYTKNYSKLLDKTVSDEEIPTGPVSMATAFKLYGLDIDNEEYWSFLHMQKAQKNQVFLSMPLDPGKKFEDIPMEDDQTKEGYVYNLTRLYGLDNVGLTICTNNNPRQWIYIENPKNITWPKARGTKGKNKRQDLAEDLNVYRVGPIEHDKAISKGEKATSFPYAVLTPDEFKALLGFPKEFPEIDGDCAGDSVPPLIAMMIASYFSMSFITTTVYEELNNHEQATLVLMKYIYETSLTEANVISLFDKYLQTKQLQLTTRKTYINSIQNWMKNDFNNFIIDIEKGGTVNDKGHRQISSAMRHFSEFRTTEEFRNWMETNCTYVLEKFNIKTKAQLNAWRLKLHPDKALTPDTKFWVWGEDNVATTNELNTFARLQGKLLRVHRWSEGKEKPKDPTEYAEFVPIQWQDFLFNYMETCFKASNEPADVVPLPEIHSEDEEDVHSEDIPLSSYTGPPRIEQPPSPEQSLPNIFIDDTDTGKVLPILDTLTVNKNMIYEDGRWFVDSKIFNIDGFQIPIIDFYMTYEYESHAPMFTKKEDDTLIIYSDRSKPEFNNEGRPPYVSEQDYARYTFLNKLKGALLRYSNAH